MGHKRAEPISEDCWHQHSMHAARPDTEAREHPGSALLGSSPESAGHTLGLCPMLAKPTQNPSADSITS